MRTSCNIHNVSVMVISVFSIHNCLTELYLNRWLPGVKLSFNKIYLQLTTSKIFLIIRQYWRLEIPKVIIFRSYSIQKCKRNCSVHCINLLSPPPQSHYNVSYITSLWKHQNCYIKAAVSCRGCIKCKSWMIFCFDSVLATKKHQQRTWRLIALFPTSNEKQSIDTKH